MTGLVSSLTFEEILNSLSFYSIVKLEASVIARLKCSSYQYDTYCVWCEKDSTFHEDTRYSGVLNQSLIFAQGEFSTEPVCARNRGHKYRFIFRLGPDGTLQKIGQYPSIEDITGAELRRYKGLLRGGFFQDLTRANGLFSHGIGIGSFVYLRRVFEKVIEDHRISTEAISGPIEGFQTMRMEDKIAALKDSLPPALVKNRATYSILSSGIHTLSEDQCRLYYPAVKAAILQILEQDFEAQERVRKEQALEREIAAINQTIRS